MEPNNHYSEKSRVQIQGTILTLDERTLKQPMINYQN